MGSVMNSWKRTAAEIMALGPVMPVIVIDDVEQAVPLARALVAGGIRALEVTLRTSAALEAIGRISAEVPEAVVGAGTVVTPDDLAAVAAAGGQFAISPGLTPELLAAAAAGEIPLIPGVATVSEMMTGMALGYDHFKFFPAAAAGGTAMLRAFAGPFPGIVFCPTGGISAADYRDYLDLPNVACVGGSWLAPRPAVAAGEWERITALAAAVSAGE